jgi:PAS domain S-box-containing protein
MGMARAGTFCIRGCEKMGHSDTNKKKPIKEIEASRSRKAKLERVKAEGFDRKKVEEKLKKAKPDKGILLNALMEHVVYRDIEMRVLWANNEACKSVGLTFEELTGRYCYEIWHGRSEPCVVCPAIKAVKTGQRQGMEVKTPDGRIWLIRAYPVRDVNGRITGSINTTLEITERRRAEKALRESEEKFKGIFEHANDCIIYLDSSGIILDVNEKAVQIFGGSKNQILNKHFTDLDIFSSEDKPILIRNFEGLLSGKEPIVTVNIKNKKGQDFVLECSASLTETGDKATNIMVIARNITERKKAEERLHNYQAQLKSLASQLTLTEERERRRIAADLHDQIGQSLVISKIKLDTLRSFVLSEDLAKELNEISDSLYQTIQNIRSLTFDLSFPVLYELGFEAAVATWLVEQIQEKYGIASEFEDDEQPKPLDDDVRVLLFRNMRELLINVVKHANANKVKVSVRKVGSEIHVSVEDNGAGFDVAKVISTSAKAGGFGFFSIRERLEELGGHLEIDSEPGRGTRITLAAPLKQQNTEGG